VAVTFPHSRSDRFGRTITSSAVVGSPAVQLAVLPEGLDQDWHPAPRRQLVAVLSGALEVGTPDGQVRRFGPGDLFLADDVGTRGHTTRAIDGPVHVLFAPMPEGAETLWEPWSAE
jgi:quercetin dioxygenase-like cupin family protein